MLNVGEKLLKIGFGQTTPVLPPLSQDPTFLIYYKRLQAAEDFALRKKLGFKYYVKPTKDALGTLFKNLADLTRKARKEIKNVPRMVTA